MVRRKGGVHVPWTREAFYGGIGEEV